jgi:nucleotide-binding universal stress UspA family protein
VSEIVHAPRIVVGVDGSAGSVLALRWALRIARAEHALIEAVGAWEYPAWTADVPLPEYSPRQEREKALNGAVDEVYGADRPAYLGVLSETATRCGCSWTSPPTPSCSWWAAAGTAGSPGCCSAR